jgi:hypothetical protein
MRNDPGFIRSHTALIRLTIGNDDLLGFGSDEMEVPFPWLELPLVHFAAWGLTCLEAAANMGRYAIELDEYGDSLLFKMDGRYVVVHSTRLERTSRIKHEILIHAWKTFLKDVQDYIVTLGLNEFYRDAWKNFQVKPSNAQYLSWDAWFDEHEQHMR